MPADGDRPPAEKPARTNPYPLWSPRFWHGMRFRDWVRLGNRHYWRMHPVRWPMAAAVFGCAVFNSLMARIQHWKYGRQIDTVELEKPPVFIIGHWRSGTTFLHELLVLDPRFTFPTSYQCFAPHHFVLTGTTIPRWLWFLLPSKRPMDNVEFGWDRPQEDEFALLALGLPSPYERMAFCNEPPRYLEYLDFDGVPEDDVALWKATLLRFARQITFLNQRRIVFKSPTHTGRLRVLSELFPGARFIHIVRDPFTVYASTLRLWRALDASMSFQLPKSRGMEDYVLDCFDRMYHGFREQAPALDERRLCEIRYEDLVADPVGLLADAYDRLELGDFALARPHVEAFLEQKRDYRRNRHVELSDDVRSQIVRRWGWYFERYGYSAEGPPPPQAPLETART